MRTKAYYLILIFFLIVPSVQSQSKVNLFFKPSDSLNISRRNSVVISEAALLSAPMIGLETYWYSDYPQSKFHFINDNADWQQMDKLGHVFFFY